MSENEIEELARRITEMLREQGAKDITLGAQGAQPLPSSVSGQGSGHDLCHLSTTEQAAVRDLIRTKRHAVKAALFVFAALVLWILKDAYMWIAGHLAFK